jgi:hypothetical protein
VSTIMCLAAFRAVSRYMPIPHNAPIHSLSSLMALNIPHESPIGSLDSAGAPIRQQWRNAVLAVLGVSRYDDSSSQRSPHGLYHILYATIRAPLPLHMIWIQCMMSVRSVCASVLRVSFVVILSLSHIMLVNITFFCLEIDR